MQPLVCCALRRVRRGTGTERGRLMKRATRQGGGESTPRPCGNERLLSIWALKGWDFGFLPPSVVLPDKERPQDEKRCERHGIDNNCPTKPSETTPSSSLSTLLHPLPSLASPPTPLLHRRTLLPPPSPALLHFCDVSNLLPRLALYALELTPLKAQPKEAYDAWRDAQSDGQPVPNFLCSRFRAMV